MCQRFVDESTGLSPLARGTPILKTFASKFSRFIPAGAGNTPAWRRPLRIIAVYPRWRGEHNQKVKGFFPKIGLSPLARGTLWPTSPKVSCDRFIPAGAGNTIPALRCRFWCAVYPRWRGEHQPTISVTGDGGGLSPLARGTRGFLRTQRNRWRFIPAGAGNTLKPANTWLT